MWESVCSDLKSATLLGSPSRRILDLVWRTTSEVQEEENEEDNDDEEGDDLKRARRERSWGTWDFTSPSIDGLWRELRLWLSCHGKWRFCFQHILKKMWSVMHSGGINKIFFQGKEGDGQTSEIFQISTETYFSHFLDNKEFISCKLLLHFSL